MSVRYLGIADPARGGVLRPQGGELAADRTYKATRDHNDNRISNCYHGKRSTEKEPALALAAPPRPTTITIKDAAERLGVHENTIRNWIDRQILDSFRLPSGHRRLPLAEVERIEEEVFGVPTSLPDVETTKAPRAQPAEPLTSTLP